MTKYRPSDFIRIFHTQTKEKTVEPLIKLEQVTICWGGWRGGFLEEVRLDLGSSFVMHKGENIVFGDGQ